MLTGGPRATVSRERACAHADDGGVQKGGGRHAVARQMSVAPLVPARARRSRRRANE